MELHKKDYAEYIETGKYDVNFEREKFKNLSQIINKTRCAF